MQDGAGPTSRIYFSQRLRLHYVDWGNAGAPPLVLVHGGRDHCRNWDWVAAALRHDWHIIAPDLRGHGDSEWASDGSYDLASFVYDLAQLVDQQQLAPVTLIGHSLGGNIAVRYSGIFPEKVKRLVAIEGLGLTLKVLAERAERDIARRMREWIGEQRALAARVPRRYATIDEAFNRMIAENKHLSPEQARHLTQHGVNQNEDGTYSWKFDNYFRSRPPYDLPAEALHQLWAAVTCPTLLVHGKESWSTNPAEDGRARHFRDAEVVSVAGAGHWVHHDRLEVLLDHVRRFFAAP
ncbi:MAG TPA: alpha/beta hydrolase [Stellaceae bacterium]|nr:alpha/beta hydrolase [Stellaceae bacterium]